MSQALESSFWLQQQSEADKIAAEGENILGALYEERMGLFTLGEYLWLQSFISKLRWGTTAEQERQFLNTLVALQYRISERKKDE